MTPTKQLMTLNFITQQSCCQPNTYCIMGKFGKGWQIWLIIYQTKTIQIIVVFIFWLGINMPRSLPSFMVFTTSTTKFQKKLLGGESNPGLLCDRQGYSPLYYQGSATNTMKFSLHYLLAKDLQCGSCEQILPCTFASSHTVAYVGFGELECNWQTFSMVNRTILSVDCSTNTHNTHNYIS